MATEEHIYEGIQKITSKIHVRKILQWLSNIIIDANSNSKGAPDVLNRQKLDVLIEVSLYACHFLMLSQKHPLLDTTKDPGKGHLLV